MDETAWDACTEPPVMLEWLRAAGRASDRKLPPTPASSGTSAALARTTEGATRLTR